MVSSPLWRGHNSQCIKTKGPTEADAPSRSMETRLQHLYRTSLGLGLLRADEVPCTRVLSSIAGRINPLSDLFDFVAPPSLAIQRLARRRV